MTDATASASPARRRRVRVMRALAVAATLGVAALTSLVAAPAAPAQAAGSVTVTVVGQPELVGVADPTYLTEVTVSGSGFQSIASGFGGIYVFFGWVDGGAWAPSQGGSTGSTYRYVYDDESNPVGYQLLVSFPGSSTEYAANGGEIASDGSWSSTMKIPGSSFESYDRDGAVTAVDCLSVQCGIITIGAHGVVSPSNESFTPISFQDLYSDDAAAQAAAAAAAAAAEPAEIAAPAPAASPAGEAPAPVTTTVIAAPAAASDDSELVPLLLGAVGGVGVLAVGAIAFLVWAVLSSRKRAAAFSSPATGEKIGTGTGDGPGSGAGPAATTPGTPSASGTQG